MWSWEIVQIPMLTTIHLTRLHSIVIPTGWSLKLRTGCNKQQEVDKNHLYCVVLNSLKTQQWTLAAIFLIINHQPQGVKIQARTRVHSEYLVTFWKSTIRLWTNKRLWLVKHEEKFYLKIILPFETSLEDPFTYYNYLKILLTFETLLEDHFFPYWKYIRQVF